MIDEPKSLPSPHKMMNELPKMQSEVPQQFGSSSLSALLPSMDPIPEPEEEIDNDESENPFDEEMQDEDEDQDKDNW